MDLATWNSLVTLPLPDEAVTFSAHFYAGYRFSRGDIGDTAERGQFTGRAFAGVEGMESKVHMKELVWEKSRDNKWNRSEKKLFAIRCLIRSLCICSFCDRVGRSVSTMELIPANLNMKLKHDGQRKRLTLLFGVKKVNAEECVYKSFQ